MTCELYDLRPAMVGCPSAIAGDRSCSPQRARGGLGVSISDNPDFCGRALPHIKIAGSLSAGYPRRPGKRRTTVVLVGAAGFCALAYVLAGCSSAHYGMTRCPAATRVGRAAMANDVKLLPDSAPSAARIDDTHGLDL